MCSYTQLLLSFVVGGWLFRAWTETFYRNAIRASDYRWWIKVDAIRFKCAAVA